MNEAETEASLHIRLPQDLVWRVGRIAADRGVEVSEVVRAAIVDGLGKLDARARAEGKKAPVSTRGGRRDGTG